MLLSAAFLLLVSFPLYTVQTKTKTKILLTNDDGWAVAQIRDEYTALKAAGYEVVLSAPADNRSGTGSSTAPPTILAQPCEFDTCPAGSPPTGFNASDPHLNYVNSFPVDSVRFGLQTLAPKLLHGRPDLVFAGTNIGNNLGPVVLISGTVGAASEAALEGFPSVAFSGAAGAQVSYTTLASDPTAASTLTAHTYTTLSLRFIKQLLAKRLPFIPLIPRGVSINVNYPSTVNCSTPAHFSFIFTRINPANTTDRDIEICGNKQLPAEATTITMGCFATVSVFNATTKGDVSAAIQKAVFKKVAPIISCLPKGKGHGY